MNDKIDFNQWLVDRPYIKLTVIERMLGLTPGKLRPSKVKIAPGLQNRIMEVLQKLPAYSEKYEPETVTKKEIVNSIVVKDGVIYNYSSIGQLKLPDNF